MFHVTLLLGLKLCEFQSLDSKLTQTLQSKIGIVTFLLHSEVCSQDELVVFTNHGSWTAGSQDLGVKLYTKSMYWHETCLIFWPYAIFFCNVAKVDSQN